MKNVEEEEIVSSPEVMLVNQLVLVERENVNLRLVCFSIYIYLITSLIFYIIVIFWNIVT